MIEKQALLKLLLRLNRTPGVSGRESAVGAVLQKALAPYTVQQYTDPLGNHFFVREGSGPTVLLAAHMDEIGFMVSEICMDGAIELVPIGFHDPALIQNQVLYLQRRQGSPLPGLSCTGRPPHLKGAAAAPPPAVMDIGAKSRAQAMEMGVSVGDEVYGARGGLRFCNGLFSGRAVDNRAGCAAMAAAFSMVDNQNIRLVAVGTVLEELGAKGAMVAAESVIPDLALVVDVSFADAHGQENTARSRCELGGGPCISYYDWSPGSLLCSLPPRWVPDGLLSAAKKAGIPVQPFVTLNCGTDACEIALSQGGIPTGGVFLPCRYIHSAVSVVDTEDIWRAACLIAAYLNSLS